MEGQACADPGVRTPIGASRSFVCIVICDPIPEPFEPDQSKLGGLSLYKNKSTKYPENWVDPPLAPHFV